MIARLFPVDKICPGGRRAGAANRVCTFGLAESLERGQTMGWGRYFLLGDFGQQMDLADHEAEIENLKKELWSRQTASSTIQQRLEMLQRESDELKLYLAAVLRLMMAKKLASADEIKAVVAAVDREDGVADNRFTGRMLPEA
jgi:hypothetical protein